MSITDVAWFSAFVIALVVFYLWMKMGRRNGYAALVNRAQELHHAGIGEVYLLYAVGKTGISGWFAFNKGTVGNMLATGCLGYMKDGKLVLEAPWWRSMVVTDELDPSLDRLKTNEHALIKHLGPVPGAQLRNIVYAVAGVNVADPVAVAHALSFRVQNMADVQAGYAAFLRALTSAGFIVD